MGYYEKARRDNPIQLELTTSRFKNIHFNLPIGGLRQRLTKHHLSGSRRKALESAITYLENNRRHMAYDQHLKAGYPIGSGVAEGACRHLVKDRMEQTGMRWTVRGAQAMLHLRATYLNDQWAEFVEHRIRREQNRLYEQTAA
ncbi:hypothetical protein V5E97_05945 [Singulisphaera sp. Ch08]|uniref:Transposase n=1 Tax=Singulisphaera sp. Ch08 TaxID=3120278 RepID=A0AAU7CJY2_9BACT